jgi:hypothetical protein
VTRFSVKISDYNVVILFSFCLSSLIVIDKYSATTSKRMERNIYLKIFEAKFHDNSCEDKRDTTCIIIANHNEQIAKTPTIYQTEKPLFLEEFDFTDDQCSQKIESLTVLGENFFYFKLSVYLRMESGLKYINSNTNLVNSLHIRLHP